MGTHAKPRIAVARLLLLVTAVAFVMILGLAGTALADETTTTVPASEPAADEATALDYTFTWPTFIVTFALVIGYYVFVFRMSEREFKGVVAERFGVKPAKGKETTP